MESLVVPSPLPNMIGLVDVALIKLPTGPAETCKVTGTPFLCMAPAAGKDAMTSPAATVWLGVETTE
jgi:hypothetical protein